MGGKAAMRIKNKMSTQGTPNPGQTLRVQNSFFNFDTFDSVTVIKDVPFAKVSTVDEAVARLGGDAQKLIDVINDGLETVIRRDARADKSGWFEKLENGSAGPAFAGEPVNEKIVNTTVLTLAKSVYAAEYAKDTGEAKEMARKLIRETPVILEGLKKSASVVETESE